MATRNNVLNAWLAINQPCVALVTKPTTRRDAVLPSNDDAVTCDACYRNVPIWHFVAGNDTDGHVVYRRDVNDVRHP